MPSGRRFGVTFEAPDASVLMGSRSLEAKPQLFHLRAVGLRSGRAALGRESTRKENWVTLTPDLALNAPVYPTPVPVAPNIAGSMKERQTCIRRQLILRARRATSRCAVRSY